MSVSDPTPWQSSAEPFTILHVEDSPGDVRLIREAFDKTPGETRIHAVTNGDDAIDVLRGEEPDGSASLPDLILLDLNLPGRDGHDVLEAVKDDPNLQRIPVIILTSSDAPDEVTRCYEAYANAYLTKPTTPDEFISMAESVQRFWFSVAILPPT